MTRQILKLRHFLYDRGFFKTVMPPVPVISIGNIAIGGTGKTPVVQMIAKHLSQKKKLAILSRGYRSQKEGSMHLVQKGDSARLVGDEPLMLARTLPQVDVWVGKRRALVAKEAVKRGAELLLLDDGMQHRQIARAFQIVVVDASDPIGKNALFPFGRLRDLPERLQTADLIIANHYRGEDVEKAIRRYTNAPIVKMRYKMDWAPLPKNAILFCALGRPHHLVRSVKENLNLIDSYLLRDHASPSAEKLEQFTKKGRKAGAQALLCTEKDFVKMEKMALSLPIIPLKAELEVVEGEELLKSLLEKMEGLEL